MFEVAELGQKLDKDKFKEREPEVRSDLLQAQFDLKERGDFSVVVIIAGLEGSGKGETVNLLLEWLDARGIETHALGMPTDEERDRPNYYRFWRRLPADGRTAFFIGSWYTEPVTEHAFDKLDDADFDYQLNQIVNFERLLVQSGVLVLKYWLHISKKVQKETFKKLEADEDESWRVTARDWELHKQYDEITQSAARAIRRTSTGMSSWEIVEAGDKRFRHMTVATHILNSLQRRLAQPPATQSAADSTMVPEPEPLMQPPPGSVNIIQALDLKQSLPGKEYEKQLEHWQGQLGWMARQLDDKNAVAIVMEGVDAAGKGGCIRRIVHPLDARFYRVTPISAPTDEERAHPYLWRFWRRVPQNGRVAVFDRSWYGRVLVERVEHFATESEWRRAYSEINAMEEQWDQHGILVLKFYLVISQEEQLKRFQAREDIPYKRYKITDEDWRNRKKWDDYETAACDMIARTSTEIAPWYLIPSEDKNFARIKILETVVTKLAERLGVQLNNNGKKHKKSK